MDARDAFFARLQEWHPAATGEEIGFLTPPLRNMILPAIPNVTLLFDSEPDFQEYLGREDYGSARSPMVWAGIVFRQDAPTWEVAIRMNATDVPTTSLVLRPDQAGMDPEFELMYLFSNASDVGSNVTQAAAAPMPGFSTLQLEVERFIVDLPLHSVEPDPQFTRDHLIVPFLAALGYTNETIEAEWRALREDPTREAQVFENLMAHVFPSSFFAPQRISFIPFPVPAYRVSHFFETVGDLFPLIFVLAVLYTESEVLHGMVYEKEARIREGLHTAGLSTGTLVTSWMIVYVFLFAIVSGIFVGVTSTTLFAASNWAVLMLLFWAFGVACTTFAWFLSSFFAKAKTATTMGGIVFLATWFPFTFVANPGTSIGVRELASICPATAISLSIQHIATLERRGVGVHWHNWDSKVENWSAEIGLWVLLVDALVFALLAWYLDHVLPTACRDFGQSWPLYFPCSPRYWRSCCGRRRSIVLDSEGDSGEAGFDDSLLDNNEFTEPIDAHLAALRRLRRCVSIRGLVRRFGSVQAVRGVTLDMFEGQIFALLGHNGAGATTFDPHPLPLPPPPLFAFPPVSGKTTTISMLSGLLEPTAGTAFVYGRDLRYDLAEIRHELGVCPQYDVLWPELTVTEHLEVYATLRGVPAESRAADVLEMIMELGLAAKKDALTKELSGGQKRKLSVAIALIGKPKVVILDEPTSGMDPYSRRKTWQVLQNSRSDRVVLLTTHAMEEAEALGDRIAVMADGQIQCCGSTLFLKQRYDVGYRLSVVWQRHHGELAARETREAEEEQIDRLVQAVTEEVPPATVIDRGGHEIAFRLPMTCTPQFPALLRRLDSDARLPEEQQRLGIVTYGISVTTLEDVFLKVAKSRTPSTADTLSAARRGAGSLRCSLLDRFWCHCRKRAASFVASDAAGLEEDEEDGAESHPLWSASASSTPLRLGDHEDEDMGPTRSKGSGKMEGIFPAASARMSLNKDEWDEEAAVLVPRGQLAPPRVRWRSAVLRRWMNHVAALFVKRFHYARRDIKTICYQLFLPLIFVTIGLGVLHANARRNAPEMAMTPAGLNVDGYNAPTPYFSFKAVSPPPSHPSADVVDVLGCIPPSNVSVVRLDPKSNLLPSSGPFMTACNQTQPLESLQRMSQYLFDTRTASPASSFGAFVSTPQLFPPSASGASQEYTIFQNSTALHALPIFQNLLASALYRSQQEDKSRPAGISLISYPLPVVRQQEVFVGPMITLLASIVIVLAMAFIPASYAIFVVKERELNVKHHQMISGLSVSAYWLSSILWDFASYQLPCFLMVLVLTQYGVRDLVSVEDWRLAATILLLLFYGLAVAGFTYCGSFLFREHSSAQNAVLGFSVFCAFLAIGTFAMALDPHLCHIEVPLRSAFRAFPPYALANGLVVMSFLSEWPHVWGVCHDTPRPIVHALSWDVAGGNIVFLAVESAIYVALAIAIDCLLLRRQLQSRWGAERDPTVPPLELAMGERDPDVEQEAMRVESLAGVRSPPDSLLLRRLRKTYPNGKEAVRGLSFGVSPGEVFGFLGVNGAGKTTTMKMLTADLRPTAGTATIAGFDLVDDPEECRSVIGYCPQFDALLELLSVREHLELYGRLKGMEQQEREREIAWLIEGLGLLPFRDKPAEVLSGGNRRKLSVAIALLGNPALVFLDEPSTGMDPVARRQMWTMLQRSVEERRGSSSILLTTHSMEECEALCRRVGIMVSGRLRCLGSIQHLKSRFGTGYTAEIRLSPPSVLAVRSVMRRLRDEMARRNEQVRQVLTRQEVMLACRLLGREERALTIVPDGAGWIVDTRLRASNDQIPVRQFAEWWAAENMMEAVVDYVTGDSFIAPGRGERPILLEREGWKVVFRIPSHPELSLGDLFARLENGRSELGIADYSLAQTSLEQVFNSFAVEEEPEDAPAGSTLAATAPPAAGAGHRPPRGRYRPRMSTTSTVVSVSAFEGE